jgi:hypothetical protein
MICGQVADLMSENNEGSIDSSDTYIHKTAKCSAALRLGPLAAAPTPNSSTPWRDTASRSAWDSRCRRHPRRSAPQERQWANGRKDVKRQVHLSRHARHLSGPGDGAPTGNEAAAALEPFGPRRPAVLRNCVRLLDRENDPRRVLQVNLRIAPRRKNRRETKIFSPRIPAVSTDKRPRRSKRRIAAGNRREKPALPD